MLKLLVIKPSSLGDIVHALQVVQSIRDQKNEVSVTWVVREIFAPLLEACPTVDEVIVFERKGGISGFLDLIKTIRQKKYDWTLDMQGLARSGLMTFFSRGNNKLGRSDARELSGLACSKLAPLPDNERHAVSILQEFLPLMGLKKVVSHRLKFDFGKQDLLPSAVLEAGPVLVFPESRRPEKNWTGYRDLIAELPDVVKRPVICMGQNPIELSDVDSDLIHNLSGKSTIGDMLGVMESASLIICNDSGPMHIAAAMGKELLALFGPTSPELYGPYPLDCPQHHVICADEGDFSKLALSTVLTKVKEIISEK